MLVIGFSRCVGALAYAKERGSMRALSGKKAPERVSDPIIYHGDVRRMLLTSKVSVLAMDFA